MAKKKSVAQSKKKDQDIQEECYVKVQIAGKTYEATGTTLLEALEKIHPTSYLGLGKIEAHKGGKRMKFPLTLVPLRMRRFFERPIERALFAKRLEILL